jgi:hypothetical protein
MEPTILLTDMDVPEEWRFDALATPLDLRWTSCILTANLSLYTIARGGQACELRPSAKHPTDGLVSTLQFVHVSSSRPLIISKILNPSHLSFLTSDHGQASIAEASRSSCRSSNTGLPPCTTISLGVETAAVWV